MKILVSISPTVQYFQIMILCYYYRYSALGPVRAETRAQSGDWYGSGMLHPGQILRGSMPLLSPDTVYMFINADTPKLVLCLYQAYWSGRGT
jgi:hypothetical protein